MAFASSLPPSALIKTKHDEGDQPIRQTKEQYRKMKELDEARKAGTVAAATDEEGRDINPHIPQFISSAPWYLGQPGSTLKHQRPHPEREKHLPSIYEIDDVLGKKGIIEGKKAAKFRKGACENCGSMTHKKRDCFERPRRIGAKYTGDEIAPDEHIRPKLNLTFESKRDRWAGYDPATHKAVVEEYEKLEEARKMIRAEQLKAENPNKDSSNATDDSTENADDADGDEKDVTEDVIICDDEDKYADDADMPGVKVDADSRTRITVRNLRIREDTAKYLYNLDPKSAYYDPKSRSMRDNPFASTGKGPDEVPFAGENFVRYTGEVTDVNRAQLFAWEAQKRGVDLHTLAEPTKLETLRHEYTDRKATVEGSIKSSILDKYGGGEHLGGVSRDLVMGQSERYVEYNRKGKLIKGEERVIIKSRYIEDFYPTNHTSVWGSYWKDGQWGFACCHQMLKNSYCTGKAGVDAAEASAAEMADGASQKEAERGDKPLAKVDIVRVTLDDRFSGEAQKDSLSKDNLPRIDSARISSDSVGGKEGGAEEACSSGSSEASESSESSDDEDLEAAKQRYEEERKKKEIRRQRRRRKRQNQKERRGGAKRQRLTNGSKASNEISSSESDDSSSDEGKRHEGKTTEAAKTRKQLIADAVAKQDRDEAAARRLLDKTGDERSLAYNSRYDEGSMPSEIEMEAYKLRKLHQSDPMASYIDKKRK